MASQILFGLAAVPVPTGATPVEINPTTGSETYFTPGVTFVGDQFDVVALGNKLYFTSDSSSNTILYSVDTTTPCGLPPAPCNIVSAAGLNPGVKDLTVATTEETQVPVPEPSTMLLLVPALAGIIGIRRRLLIWP